MDLRVTYNRQYSLFLRKLPPEIRNKVYEYVLQGHIICVNVDALSVRREFAHTAPKELSSLPQVCHQIHAETAKLVFGLTTSRLPAREAGGVLRYLGQEQASLMQVLIIDLQKPKSMTFRGDEELVNLKILTFEICRLKSSGSLRRIEFLNNIKINSNGENRRWCGDAGAECIVAHVRSALEESASEREIVVEFTPGKIVTSD